MQSATLAVARAARAAAIPSLSAGCLQALATLRTARLTSGFLLATVGSFGTNVPRGLRLCPALRSRLSPTDPQRAVRPLPGPIWPGCSVVACAAQPLSRRRRVAYLYSPPCLLKQVHAPAADGQFWLESQRFFEARPHLDETDGSRQGRTERSQATSTYLPFSRALGRSRGPCTRLPMDRRSGRSGTGNDGYLSGGTRKPALIP